MDVSEQRKYLSVRETANVLGVSQSTVRRAIFEGSLPAIRVREGGTLRIPRAAVVDEKEES